MSASAPYGAVPRGGPLGPPGWGGPPRGGWSPWALAWSVPKPFLIAAMVLSFIAFWPLGLAVLFFLLGSGRLGKRWARRDGGDAAAGGDACGWGGWRRDEAAMPSSGNQAFDAYRVDTLRRLEEEQREFAAFLERLRFAKDKAEFDQFMADRRGAPRRDGPPPQAETPAQG